MCLPVAAPECYYFFIYFFLGGGGEASVGQCDSFGGSHGQNTDKQKKKGSRNKLMSDKLKVLASHRNELTSP